MFTRIQHYFFTWQLGSLTITTSKPVGEHWYSFIWNLLQTIKSGQISNEMVNSHIQYLIFFLFALKYLQFTKSLLTLKRFLPVIPQQLTIKFLLLFHLSSPKNRNVCILLFHQGTSIPSNIVNSRTIYHVVSIPITWKTLLQILLMIFNQQLPNS